MHAAADHPAQCRPRDLATGSGQAAADHSPVVPAQAASSDASVDLKRHRDPEEQVLLLRDEQRRQQQRREQAEGERYEAMPGDEVNADNTVPVAPLGERTRQGLLVDIEV